jgi:c-di-GMP-binding flagellar brake protein YcgR
MKSQTWQADRRLSFRHSLQIPLQVRIWKTNIPTQRAVSENVSTSGILFATNLPIAVGTVVEVVMKMPEQLTGESASLWRCSGHVVRVQTDAHSSRKSRVGVQFDCYEIAREEAVVMLPTRDSLVPCWPRV